MSNTTKRSAKEVRVHLISPQRANKFIRETHYSGKVVNNSRLHFGAFLDGRLHGVMQFGPSMDKRHTIGLVADTHWNSFVELNRLAFDNVLPRNSESRCLSFALGLIKKRAPHVKWVISFADGVQCGDGTIYRACGFILTGIKKNTTIIRLGNGEVVSNITYSKANHAIKNNGKSAKPKDAVTLPGFMLRYVYFIDPAARQRLTVPEIPYSRIAEMGATMYKGMRPSDGGTPAPTG